MSTTAELPPPSISDSVQQMAAEAEEQYRKLVLSIADGEDVSPLQVRVVLNGAGRSFHDLEGHVQRIRKRADLVARLKQAGELRAKADGLESKARRLEIVYQEVYKRCTGEIGRAEQAAFSAQRAVESVQHQAKTLESESRQQLLKTADPAIEQQMQALYSRLTGLREAIEARQREVEVAALGRRQFDTWGTPEYPGLRGGDFGRMPMVPTPFWHPLYGQAAHVTMAHLLDAQRQVAEQRLARAEGTAALAEQELASLRPSIADMEKRVEELEQRRLDSTTIEW